MDSSFLASMYITIMAIISTILLGKRNKWGWAINISVYIVWGIQEYSFGQRWYALAAIVLLVLSIWNLLLWKYGRIEV